MAVEASSSGSPTRVAPSATPWTGACAFNIASKSPAEIMLGNSTSSMSSRSLNRARPCCDIDSVMKIFFLLVAIPSPLPSPLAFLVARPSKDDAGDLFKQVHIVEVHLQ